MKYLSILFIVLAMAFVSCKKEPQSAISGKWQQTKLVISVYSNKAVWWDSTYLSPFTKFDYIQFNDNGSSVIAGDFYLNTEYEPGGSSFSKPIHTSPSSSSFNYSASGSVYVLTSTISQPPNFAAAYTTDTASIRGDTLLLHEVNYFGPGVNSIFDNYYIRQ